MPWGWCAKGEQQVQGQQQWECHEWWGHQGQQGAQEYHEQWGWQQQGG